MAIEIEERGGRMFVRAELPGLTKVNVKVEARDDALIIEGERKTTHEEKSDAYYKTECSYARARNSSTAPRSASVNDLRALRLAEAFHSGRARSDDCSKQGGHARSSTCRFRSGGLIREANRGMTPARGSAVIQTSMAGASCPSQMHPSHSTVSCTSSAPSTGKCQTCALRCRSSAGCGTWTVTSASK
jgi:hypothetical protein